MIDDGQNHEREYMSVFGVSVKTKIKQAYTGLVLTQLSL
jgi:hypothetical protein